eukprot:COSAG02_NODE_64799_length_259_cov_1.012500_1_plen_27_part_01
MYIYSYPPVSADTGAPSLAPAAVDATL